MSLDREPVVEELFQSQNELESLKDEHNERKLLGYHFWCNDCVNDSLTHNPYQMLCPKCGAPNLADDGDHEPLQECWTHENSIDNYHILKKALTTKEKEHAIGSS